MGTASSVKISNLADALADEAFDKSSTERIERMINGLLDVIENGADVSAIDSSSLNGKSFHRYIDLSPLEKLEAARTALKIYNGTDAMPVSYPDFSRLNR